MKESVRGTPKTVGKKKIGSPSSREPAGFLRYAEPEQGSSLTVSETDAGKYGTRGNIEAVLSDIVARLERIEEKIDETVYPPESAIRPEYVRKVKKARSDLAAGKGKEYDSMDAFLRAVSE